MIEITATWGSLSRERSPRAFSFFRSIFNNECWILMVGVAWEIFDGDILTLRLLEQALAFVALHLNEDEKSGRETLFG